MTEIGPILLFLVVVSGIFALSAFASHRRRQQWQAMAEQFGFRAVEGDPLAIRENEPGFALFGLGHSKKVLRTMEGRSGEVALTVFDYRYKTGSGKHQSTHTLSAIAAELPIDCPRLAIRPEHFGDRIAASLGFDDIDFESDAFNRRFHVKGADKKFAYDICHPGMMEYLIEVPEFCWELLGRRLLLYSRRLKTFDADELVRSLRTLDGFVTRLPNYLTSRGPDH